MMAAASMTHESGFHMKPKNLRILLSCSKRLCFFPLILLVQKGEETGPRGYLFLFEFVITKDLEPLLDLISGETDFRALQLLENFFDGDVLLRVIKQGTK